MGETKRIKVLAFVGLAAAALGVVLSCQDKRGAMAVRHGGHGATTMATTGPVTEGGTVGAASEGEIDAIALGFSYPAAPVQGKSHSRDELKTISEAASCTACHTGYGIWEHTMHNPDNTYVGITCVECHGGNDKVSVPRDIKPGDPQFAALQDAAHVKPVLKELWGKGSVNPKGPSSRNPEIPAAATNQESVDYIRFVNPGDLRAAVVACAPCHKEQSDRTRTSMMNHGAMLWGAALYNNGSINRKNAVYGEQYTIHGEPARVIANPPPTTQQTKEKGQLAELWPLQRWEISQPGNILRVFERGGRIRPLIGVPDILQEPGKPDVKLSLRGYGTDVRTDPVTIGLQKTRLLDPTLGLFGTNDHPGDYRGSGCTACHVVYANDRSSVHAAKWSKFGNRGHTSPENADPMVPKQESGHPIAHQFERQVPSSQCIVCHVHPGTNVINSYLGFMWWDNETDGEFMYPKKQHNPSMWDEYNAHQHNPEGSAARGLWSNLYPEKTSHAGEVAGPDFLERVSELNPKLKHTQFADFHGHGWIFRAVYKQDRKGNLLDRDGNIVQDRSAQKLGEAVAFQSDDANPRPPAGSPVHMKDIHLERGMHCGDCHFSQDNHGDGKLYAETRAAVMVDCVDCHGDAEKSASIFRYLSMTRSNQNNETGRSLLADMFTGSAAQNGFTPAQRQSRNRQILSQHFEVKGGRLWQKSAMDPKKGWFVVQTAETADPNSAWSKDKNTPAESAKMARFAHTVRRDAKTWGTVPTAADTKDNPQLSLAHSSSNMTCYACHTSWTTACFGCHLPQRANQKKLMQHNEGAQTRNYTNYNFQTLRDDLYMLGVDSTVKGHKVVPVRSSCAVLVSSEDANRNQIYFQQQTVSAEGFSGTAFSVYFPHTVRARETKTCTDCHISKENDNNAIMAQIMVQGINATNFIGRFAWVAQGSHGVEAVGVSARTEPQAVFGSTLHQLAYPDDYKKHVAGGMKLEEAHEHGGTVLDLQNRGEYLYAACGPDGFRAYDIATIDNKGFSERFITAPVSPLGQRFYVDTKYATSVISPSTMAVDPTRPRLKENEEGAIHPMFAFLYVTDREEGVVVIGNSLNTPKEKGNIGVATLLDGDPDNNFLSRALAFNPQNMLHGARSMTFYGHYGYVCCDNGIAVVDFNNPLAPRLVTMLNPPGLSNPKKVQFQFRYGFVVDEEGLKVIDVTDPERPRLVGGAEVALGDARDVYISRTYAYVAAGKQGLAIIDVERPEQPKLDQIYDADGKMNDAYNVKVAMTNASIFAYVADGRNGLKVLQLTSPESQPNFLGFSPRPMPKLIAVHKTAGPALAVAEGLDRDRAVDEMGNQIAVFGRRGARPFNYEEQRRMWLRTGADGQKSVFMVGHGPETEPLKPAAPASAPAAATAPAEPRRRFPGRPGAR